jgi:steroid delta-isomerase-like uncharacterized protein
MNSQLLTRAGFITLLVIPLTACQTSTLQGPESRNEAAARAFYAALDANDFAAFDEIAAPDCQLFLSGAPGPLSLADLKAVIPLYYTSFPDYSHTIQDVIAAGDKVVVRATASGTHQAEFEGLPATGNSIEYEQIAILRFVDGQLVEGWVVEDNLTMMTQLGLELMPGEAEG